MNIFHRLSRSLFSLSSPPRNLTKRRHRLFLGQAEAAHTTMENLPDEVLSDIFIRLLAKQLAQMRCVCKTWNSLLSDTYFIKSHLHRSIQKNNEILLFFGVLFSLDFDLCPFTARPSCSPNLELTNLIKPPVIPDCSEYGLCHVIGSVNGLICFVHGSRRDGFLLHIWNPSLSAISSPPQSLPDSSRLRFGFGFDPKTDDYKILKLTSFSRAPNKLKRAEVYTMRTGSWKLITPQTSPSHVTIPEGHNSQVCVDDNLHWLCDTHLKSKPPTIVAFDLSEEAFFEMPLPETILDLKVYKPVNVLGALGGKLCVISRVRDGKWEVWVMDEYAVSESWVKRHVFSQFGGNIVPYGFTSHGDFLFQVGENDDRFGLYDPIAAKTKTFKFVSIYCPVTVCTVVEYVDSLVWVPPPSR